MNEETIAGVVGWGQDAGLHRQQHHGQSAGPRPYPSRRRQGRKGNTVFRAGEAHGRITPRAEEVCRLVALSDSAKVTDNLWGERWSKLVANVMGNGLSACTGLPGGEILQSEAAAPVFHSPGQRGDPRRPGARLPARGDPASSSPTPSPAPARASEAAITTSHFCLRPSLCRREYCR